MESLSSIPDRLLTLKSAYVAEEKQPVQIASAKEHKGMTLIRLSGYDDINRVLQWKGDYLYVREDEVGELPEGSWYRHELIGLRCVTYDGEMIGEITEVIEAPANDVLVIRKVNGESTMVPFVEAYVGEIDLQARTVVLSLIEGM